MAGAYGNMGVNSGSSKGSTGQWQKYWAEQDAKKATTAPPESVGGLSLQGSQQVSGPGGVTSYNSTYGPGKGGALAGLQQVGKASASAYSSAQQAAQQAARQQQQEDAAAQRAHEIAMQSAAAGQKRNESSAALAEQEGANNRATAAAESQYTRLAGTPEAPISRSTGASAEQEQTARDAAYTRSRTQIANTSRSSLNGLSAELQRRGMGGGGYEAGEIGQRLGQVAGDATGLAEQQAAGEAKQASHIADVDYQGQIQQRGQRQASLDGLRNILLGGKPRY